MTIPFETGIFANAQIGSSCRSNWPTLGLRAEGFAVKALSRDAYGVVCRAPEEASIQPAECRCVHSVFDALMIGGYPPGTCRAWSFQFVLGLTKGRRISAGYFATADIRHLWEACRIAALVGR
jgi:hypothetical protein